MSSPKIEDVLPLTPLQKGLLFHAELSEGEEDVYTVQLVVELEGPLRAEDLWAAGDALMERQPTLRVAFRRRKNGDPVQVMIAGVRAPHRETDLSECSEGVAEIAAKDRTTSFNLSKAPALRLTLLRLGANRHTLLVTSHHILLDGWSMPVFIEELLALHEVYASGGEWSAEEAAHHAGLPPVSPYREYIRWLESRNDEAAAAAWKAELSGLEGPTHLVPLERGQPQPIHVSSALSFGDQLKAAARRYGLTVNSVVQAAWAIVLSRLVRREDVVFGAIVSGRPPELQGSDRMLGLFINTLPVRVRVRDGASFLETADAVQKRWAAIREHGHLGLSEIRRASGVSDVFDTLLVFQNYPSAQEDKLTTTRVIEITGHDATHYPVSLVVNTGDEIAVKITHRKGAVIPGGSDQLLTRVIRVLEAFASDPHQKVGEIDLLLPRERELLLGDWIHTGLDRAPVAPGRVPPIGRPIPNARAYVLDPHLHLMPPGVSGELYLAGPGIARGYLGQSALTAERFLPDPYGEAGSRMYRTGDLGRWREDGQVEFLGRVDHQVKINGFRVEPGEVEVQLLGQAEVRHAIVVVREDIPGVRRLVAYLVAAPGFREPTAQVLAGLRESLPSHLVPDALVWLDRIPTNAHDKVDRAALPAPVVTRAASSAQPRNETERLVLALVHETLRRDDITVDDNLFAMGCDSLAAARLVSRVRTDTGRIVSIRSLYASPSAAGLAAALDQRGKGAFGLEVLLPLSTVGEGPPLFCIHPGGGLGWSYAALTQWITDRPVYALQAQSLTHSDKAPTSVASMARYYVDQLREVQPDGPYHLLGWSFGGVVAHTMAAHLADQGQSVGLLAMLDSFPKRRWTKLGVTEIRRGILEALGLSEEGVTTVDLTPEILIEAARRKGHVLGELDEPTVSSLVGGAKHHLELMDIHRAPIISGDLLVFEASVRTSQEPDLATEWAPFVSGTVNVQSVPVSHEDMLGAYSLAVVGPQLQQHLQGA